MIADTITDHSPHDPGDENDNSNITMAEAAEMIPEDIAEKIHARNKLREEIEEENFEQE
tara:strand:- start:112 stop:288 length:177 start_codon:yes stop_codon:yes gene_type:complete